MQMTLRRFVKDLQNALGTQAQNKATQLGKGQCGSFEDYKKMTGYIAGLEAGIAISDQMLRALEDASHEAEDQLPEMPSGDAK